MTGEHALSKSVHDFIFYPIEYIGTRTWCSLYGNKPLINSYPRVRDVCKQCNSDLHEYDDHGKILMQAIKPFPDITGVKIPFDEKILGWLIKTHLNLIRAFPNKESRKKYVFNKSILNGIISYTPIPTNLYRLCVEGWQGADYLWDGQKRINALYFFSCELLRQRTLVSDLRLQTFKTFLIVPADSDYTDFESRSMDAFEEMKRDYGFHIEMIEIEKAITDGFIFANQIKPLQEILNGIATISFCKEVRSKILLRFWL